MSVRKRLFVSGVVQGVFFRDSARRIAREHGVAGSARNLSDGRVELVLEGDEAALDAIAAWAKNGPELAEVHGVEVIDEEVEGLTGFEIR